MNDASRTLTYVQALNETLHQLMEADERVTMIGQGVTSPWYVGATTTGLIDRFGGDRVIDTPVSENAITGVAVGAAIAGLRPIVEHPRMDFMYLAMDQIANQAANWYFMFGQRISVPMTVWGIINRGGEQAAQHSQALQALFMHLPGLKVVMPSTPFDAKGLLAASVYDDNPVLFIDDRWLYSLEGNVPEELYCEEIGKGVIRREGQDLTLIAFSHMAQEALKAADELQKKGIDAEVIDPRSLKPLDDSLIFQSVEKTGRVVIADGGWKTCGLSAEISALISENAFSHLLAPIARVALPDTPAPASGVLEKHYYPDSQTIVDAALRVLERA
jgi:pyruvate/2-oxoglutarate/acetoin dehydrogenase E1 component